MFLTCWGKDELLSSLGQLCSVYLNMHIYTRTPQLIKEDSSPFTVAGVQRVNAEPLRPTLAWPRTWQGATPVDGSFVVPSNPPAQGGPIWKANLREVKWAWLPLLAALSTPYAQSYR
jgi:hypothetical protein